MLTCYLSLKAAFVYTTSRYCKKSWTRLMEAAALNIAVPKPEQHHSNPSRNQPPDHADLPGPVQ